MNYGMYLSYAAFKRYRGIAVTETADDTRIRLMCRYASAQWDRMTRRPCWPEKKTRYYDLMNSRYFTLDSDLLAITSLTDSSGNTLVEGTDVLAYPLSGPPYNRIEIKLDSGESLNYSGTTQKAITLAGVWGWHDDWANAFEASGDTVLDTGGITAAATSITVSDADGADAWGVTPRFDADTLLKIEDEYLWLTALSTSTNILTVVRGVNGSTAATHAKTTPIYVYKPPQDMAKHITRWVMFLYDQKDTGQFETVVYPEAGVTRVPAGIPVDVAMGIDQHRQRKVR
jgi:hypothetical protein